MVWRTVVLSAVNMVTGLLVFVPVVSIITPGFERALYLHSTSPPWLFFIQVALGIFAVVIDMLNGKPHLQSKLLAAAVALSATLAGITIWMFLQADHIGCYATEYKMEAGTLLPVLNVVLFGAVWFHQRRRMRVNEK